jgi:hypothetical protein
MTCKKRMFEEMARRPGAAEADEGYEGQGSWDGTRCQPSNLESCSDRGRPSLDPMTATIASTHANWTSLPILFRVVRSKNKDVLTNTTSSHSFATQLYHSLLRCQIM